MFINYFNVLFYIPIVTGVCNIIGDTLAKLDFKLRNLFSKLIIEKHLSLVNLSLVTLSGSFLFVLLFSELNNSFFLYNLYSNSIWLSLLYFWIYIFSFFFFIIGLVYYEGVYSMLKLFNFTCIKYLPYLNIYKILPAEYFALISILIVFLCVLINITDIILLYVIFEITNIIIYSVVGISQNNPKATEAGIRYYFISFLSSLFCLWGTAYLYGFTGVSNYKSLIAILGTNFSFNDNFGLLLGVSLIILSFVIKLGAFPAHSWVCSVYESLLNFTFLLLIIVVKLGFYLSLLEFVLNLIIKSIFFPYFFSYLFFFISVGSVIGGSALLLTRSNIKGFLVTNSVISWGILFLGLSIISSIPYYSITNTNYWYIIIDVLHWNLIYIIIYLNFLYITYSLWLSWYIFIYWAKILNYFYFSKNWLLLNYRNSIKWKNKHWALIINTYQDIYQINNLTTLYYIFSRYSSLFSIFFIWVTSGLPPFLLFIIKFYLISISVIYGFFIGPVLLWFLLNTLAVYPYIKGISLFIIRYIKCSSSDNKWFDKIVADFEANRNKSFEKIIEELTQRGYNGDDRTHHFCGLAEDILKKQEALKEEIRQLRESAGAPSKVKAPVREPPIPSQEPNELEPTPYDPREDDPKIAEEPLDPELEITPPSQKPTVPDVEKVPEDFLAQLGEFFLDYGYSWVFMGFLISWLIFIIAYPNIKCMAPYRRFYPRAFTISLILSAVYHFFKYGKKAGSFSNEMDFEKFLKKAARLRREDAERPRRQNKLAQETSETPESVLSKLEEFIVNYGYHTLLLWIGTFLSIILLIYLYWDSIKTFIMPYTGSTIAYIRLNWTWYCTFCVILILTICLSKYYTSRPKTDLSSWKNYIKNIITNIVNNLKGIPYPWVFTLDNFGLSKADSELISIVYEAIHRNLFLNEDYARTHSGARPFTDLKSALLGLKELLWGYGCFILPILILILFLTIWSTGLVNKLVSKILPLLFLFTVVIASLLLTTLSYFGFYDLADYTLLKYIAPLVILTFLVSNKAFKKLWRLLVQQRAYIWFLFLKLIYVGLPCFFLFIMLAISLCCLLTTLPYFVFYISDFRNKFRTPFFLSLFIIGIDVVWSIWKASSIRQKLRKFVCTVVPYLFLLYDKVIAILAGLLILGSLFGFSGLPYYDLFIYIASLTIFLGFTKFILWVWEKYPKLWKFLRELFKLLFLTSAYTALPYFFIIQLLFEDFYPLYYVILTLTPIVILVFIILVPFLLMSGYLSLAERQIVALVQQRFGPSLTGGFASLLQPVADGIKLLLKEIIIPEKGITFLYLIAPIWTFSLSMSVWSFIPLSSNKYLVLINDRFSLLILIVLLILAGFGPIIGGLASGNKIATIGAHRAIALNGSFGVTIGLALLNVVAFSSSFNIFDIVFDQINSWNIFSSPDIAVLFYIIILTEVKKVPFDVAESEAELSSGYLIEYSGFNFALYILAEYSSILFLISVYTITFLGGWLPLTSYSSLSNSLLTSLSYIDFFIVIKEHWLFSFKISVVLLLYFIIRSVLPNLRFDYIMLLHWKYLFPFLLASSILGIIVN